MRVNDLMVDGEVLRHFEAMRDNLTDLVEEWLSLEQLMVEHELMFINYDHTAKWYNSSQYAMCALENLITIVKEAPTPLPLHWERWKRDTAASLERIQAQIDLAFTDSKRS